ncbi:hypothetical protein [Actinomyces bowdenii]|uniref:DUF4276 family protein n=1 Tax=Actinomyces bowdenii TaxID=131109 RepID=A0A853EMI3_9ACTO|nr:hypothetical protein [Actinomyces bowdenii]MBF0696813.1 hypothetical protein [Actinomyces bowdenii]NYS68986.1 hypothetical protein [Actinomyces bowdenii]
MIEYWQCGFVGEGPSDNRLIPVLEDLLMQLRPAADIVLEPHRWIEMPADRSVAAKVQALKDEPYDLIFVHRDADSAGWEARAQEICSAAKSTSDKRLVPVIPIRMTEAWALADLWSRDDFREWCSGEELTFTSFEKKANPKKILREYLSRGEGGLIGPKKFADSSARVLRGIAIDGPIKELDGWRRLIKEVREAMCRCRPHLKSVLWDDNK